MRPWKAILAAFVIFLAGLASGGLAVRLYSNAAQKPKAPTIAGKPPTPWSAQRVDFIRRMGPKLDLTKEQQEKIDSILHESQQRMHKLWEPLAPQAEAEMADVRKRIDEVLTVAQHERFQKLLKERPARTAGETSGWRRRDARGEGAPPQQPPAKGAAPDGPPPPSPTDAPPAQQPRPQR